MRALVIVGSPSGWLLNSLLPLPSIYDQRALEYRPRILSHLRGFGGPLGRSHDRQHPLLRAIIVRASLPLRDAPGHLFVRSESHIQLLAALLVGQVVQLLVFFRHKVPSFGDREGGADGLLLHLGDFSAVGGEFACSLCFIF